ncbi:MAG: 23S rRNA (guanosine(2251)-2'-O)-methyltransferase RlmB [Chloroflexi bacterium]|nr:23S rRNA (guanosine(2251)-2'-O)-methyltransferase RlmB [Chloroflexota bacterium]
MEVLYGRNPVREALLARRRRVHRVLIAQGVQERDAVADILALCEADRIPVTRVERRELDRLGKDANHQGVAAQASYYPYVELSDLLAAARERNEAPFLLALDALEDPQNVGSLLRSAEAVGVHGVVLTKRRAVGITPAVSRASSGAVEHLLVAQITNLARTLESLKREGLWIVGVEQHPDAQPYRQADLDRPLVLVLGSEGHGMHRLIAETCDLLVRIPMRGRIGSLNVSVAGALALYAAWEARGG